MNNDPPTVHLTTDSLVSNGSGGGTAASEGGHRLQVRLVMGGHTSGGTVAMLDAVRCLRDATLIGNTILLIKVLDCHP